MSSGSVVLLLALLLGLQPITTDLYLPALPGLTRELGATMAQAQLTLTALLLAFGISQLFWGPLSDRFGRRPVLLVGTAAYVLASVACAMAQQMEQLIFWRTVQGAAMGATVMCARAVVRDLYAPAQGAGVMSKGLSGLGLIACLSPPLGGLLTAWLNWHAALLSVAVFGSVCLALIALRFEESLVHTNPHALRPANLARTWIGITTHPTFWAFTMLTMSAYCGLFTFLAASSFVFIQVLHFSTTEYGLVMFGSAFTYLIGTFLCRRLLARYGVRRTVGLAAVLTFGGGTLMGVLALAGIQSAWAILLPFSLFMLAHGVHNPCGQSGSVGPFPQAAGTASAINGCFTMLGAFVTGQYLGQHMDGTVQPLVFGVWFWSTITALTAWTLVARYGKH
jgi:DHA1 family bicyclomycin/chloramphenicol resistance-like MFS transporter